MANLPLETLRERLAEQLAEWGAQFEAVLEELALKRREVEALRRAASVRDERLESLEERVRGQEKLIDTLKAEADEASTLRREIGARDLEVERLRTELDARQGLIGPLRREAKEAQRLRAALQNRDQELALSAAELEQAAAGTATLEKQLETAAGDTRAEEAAELQAMRVELEARKTLIRELRADAGRARALDKRLWEERAVVERLEADVRQHVETIRMLEQAVAQWKRKCQQLEDERGAADASDVEEVAAATAPAQLAVADDAAERGRLAAVACEPLCDHKLAGAPPAEDVSDNEQSLERTIVIDMRQSLLQARRYAGKYSDKE